MNELTVFVGSRSGPRSSTSVIGVLHLVKMVALLPFVQLQRSYTHHLQGRGHAWEFGLALPKQPSDGWGMATGRSVRPRVTGPSGGKGLGTFGPAPGPPDPQDPKRVINADTQRNAPLDQLSTSDREVVDGGSRLVYDWNTTSTK